LGILGIGTDIIKTARFEGVTPRFTERAFTPNERAYLFGKPIASAAGLFAAKEAVAKALGTGFRGFWPNDIEIYHDEWGKPQVQLHNGAKEAAGDCRIHISISHTDTDAIAFAVIEK